MSEVGPSDPRYRVLVDALEEGFVFQDRNGHVVFSNPAASRILGLSAEQLRGRTAADPDWHAEFEDGSADPQRHPSVVALQTGRPVSNVVMHVAPTDGLDVWVSVNARPVFEDDDPAPSGVVVSFTDVTEQRSTRRALRESVGAEEAVRRSEQRLTTLLEHSSDVVIVLDATGSLRYVSPSAPLMFGFALGSHLGTDVFELVHPDDRQRAQEALSERVASTSRRDPFEVRIAHAEGGWRHLELVASNLLGDPTINGIVLNARDVTERRQAEDVVRESEERLNALLRHSSDIIVVTDAAGTLQVVSSAAERMLGFEISTWLGRNVLELVHPEDRELAALSLANTATVAGAHPPLRLRLADADGTWRPVEVLANNLLDNRSIAGIVLNVRDISDRLKAEAALEESESRYRRIVEVAQEGIWTIDADGVTTYANNRMGELLGRDAAGMIGAHLFEFMDDEGRGIAEVNLERRNAGLSENHDFKFVRSDGTPVWTIMSTSPILGDDGAYLGALALVTDVTERRRVEDALREAEIDRQLREAELERNRLEAELAQAQRLESLGRLAGGVAHDFNNLLGVILNYTGFVAKRLDASDPIAADVAEIRKAAERATDLTRQLLLFGRREVVRAAVFDLNEAIDSAAPMIRRTLGGVELEVELTPHPTPVLADRGQIEQVLMNLLLNARDATGGRGTATVRTRRHDPVEPAGPSFVEFSVRDDGEGMTPEVLEQAFEPFFTTKSRDHGSGLGLASVDGIVRRAGGDISVETEPGVGTTVTLTLLLNESCAIEDRPDEAETLLVVDDEPELRAVTARILRESGYRVLEASTGLEALDLLEHEAAAAALVITDVVMPEMSGPQLAQQLTGSRPDVPVLLMSGYAHDDLAHDHELRAALLAKPFTEAELLEAVRSALSTTRSI